VNNDFADALSLAPPLVSTNRTTSNYGMPLAPSSLPPPPRGSPASTQPLDHVAGVAVARVRPYFDDDDQSIAPPLQASIPVRTLFYREGSSGVHIGTRVPGDSYSNPPASEALQWVREASTPQSNASLPEAAAQIPATAHVDKHGELSISQPAETPNMTPRPGQPVPRGPLGLRGHRARRGAANANGVRHLSDLSGPLGSLVEAAEEDSTAQVDASAARRHGAMTHLRPGESRDRHQLAGGSVGGRPARPRVIRRHGGVGEEK